MGSTASPNTTATSEAAGTFLWVDPRPTWTCVVLTDREFGDWAVRGMARILGAGPQHLLGCSTRLSGVIRRNGVGGWILPVGGVGLVIEPGPPAEPGPSVGARTTSGARTRRRR